jgi:hypothetical protein
VGLQSSKARINLTVLCNIERKTQAAIKFGRHLFDPLLKPIILIGKRQLGALSVTRLGNSVGD